VNVSTKAADPSHAASACDSTSPTAAAPVAATAPESLLVYWLAGCKQRRLDPSAPGLIRYVPILFDIDLTLVDVDPVRAERVRAAAIPAIDRNLDAWSTCFHVTLVNAAELAAEPTPETAERCARRILADHPTTATVAQSGARAEVVAALRQRKATLQRDHRARRQLEPRRPIAVDWTLDRRPRNRHSRARRRVAGASRARAPAAASGEPSGSSNPGQSGEAAA
jgi:hypothetical protein